MLNVLKKVAKWLMSNCPVALTKNEQYDRLTVQIVQRVCTATSVCVDGGAHNGKLLRHFIRLCPQAMHHAFEPLPHLHALLARRYGSAAIVHKKALAATSGQQTFFEVTGHAALSGLKKQPRLAAWPTREHLVYTIALDDALPPGTPVQLLKLDIEGGEWDALQGARKTIATHRPYILFEFGKGGSDAYGATAQQFERFFGEMGYRLYLLAGFVGNKPPLPPGALHQHYVQGKEYFFLASPGTGAG